MFNLDRFFGGNHVYKVETIVIVGVLLLAAYVLYSLKLIGPKKN